MKLLQVAIGKNGYKNPAGNSARIELLGKILQLADRSKAAGVVLPAGFWAVEAPSRVSPFAKSIKKMIGHCGIAVIAGIDVVMECELSSGKRGPTSCPALKKGSGLGISSLPYYGFAIDSWGSLVGPFQQQSRTAKDAIYARPLNPEHRWVRIGEGKVAVLVCGEGHNKAYRQALAERPADAVAMIGHDGLGQGLVPTITCIARITQRPVLHVQHLAMKARLHFADESAVCHPVDVHDTLCAPFTEGGPWFAWAVRKIRLRRVRPS
ncbi:hypothetical protein [Corallococcus macrosporus]|uniref:hypothetical protein n=1 Tax=Corallococcus macrosporus TaxID=35 RepID=UPI000F514144|nr:hypothetical protein [Corallococcus macrosporus]